MYAVQLLSEAYNFCYVNLKKSNIQLPAPDQVISLAKNTVSYSLSHSPVAIQNVYNVFSEIVIQSNFMGVFLSLFILYIIYRTVMAMFRWFYRIIYGFVRFSLMVLLLGGFLYMARFQLFATPTEEHATHSYDYHRV